jgi:hypothetical protein
MSDFLECIYTLITLVTIFIIFRPSSVMMVKASMNGAEEGLRMGGASRPFIEAERF